MDNYEPELGDIVLLRQPDGTQIPAIVTQVISPTSVLLDFFGRGGAGGSIDPFERGDASNQWQPKPPNRTIHGNS